MNDNGNVSIDSTENALLVDGIENWIAHLIGIGEERLPEVFLRLQDSKTGAVFLIRRIK